MKDVIREIYNNPNVGYGVNSVFDVKEHARVFKHYCEVVIDKYGKVYYATPSHHIFLYTYAAVQYGLLDEVYLLPNKTYERVTSNLEPLVFGYLNDNYGIERAWIFEKVMEDTGLVMLHYNNIQHSNELTEAQKETLTTMIEFGVIERRLETWVR